MSNLKYLLRNGWKYEPTLEIYRWRDPINLLSVYSEKNAVLIQQERDNQAALLKEKETPHEMNGCDHKFIDSNICLKCGWNPKEKETK